MKNVEERRNRTIAREANHHATMRAPHIDKTAISPYDDYCDGYGMPGAYGNGYVSVLKVSAGTVEKTNDELVDRIVTYDKAEAADAYVGQINMLTASSFCGMAGQVWGYDLARHDSVDIPVRARTPSARTRASSPTARRPTARSRRAKATACGPSSPSPFPPIATSRPTCSSRMPACGPRTTTKRT